MRMRAMARVGAISVILLVVTAAMSVAVPPATAVVNGAPAREGEMRFTIALLDRDDLATKGAFQAQFCGGALTTPTTVITAAHCVINPSTLRPLQPQSVVVASGSDLKSQTLKFADIASIAIHPKYRVRTTNDDVAVITLAAPLIDVPTVSVQQAGDPQVAAGSPALVAGWGNTEASRTIYPQTLTIGKVSIFPPNSCGGGDPFAVSEVIFNGYTKSQANPDTMVCAAGVTADKEVIDACQGDSGSPLVTSGTKSPRLIGVVSWGQDCATLHPGVYTRLSAYSSFLESNGAFGAPVAPDITVHPLNGSARVAFTATRRPTLFVATATMPDGSSVQCASKPSRTIVPATCVLTGIANNVPVPVTAHVIIGSQQSPASEPVLVTPADLPDPGTITKIAVRRSSATIWVTPSPTPRTVDCTSNVAAPVLTAPVPAGATRAPLSGVRRINYVCVIRGVGGADSTESAPRLLAGQS